MNDEKNLLKKSVFRRTENGNIPTEQCLYYTVYEYKKRIHISFGYQCSLGKSNIILYGRIEKDLILSIDKNSFPTVILKSKNRTVKRIFFV